VSLTETTNKAPRKAQVATAKKAAALKAANQAKRPQPPWLQAIRTAPARETPPPAASERVGEVHQSQGPPRLMSKAEVLVVAGCTYPTLWKMMREGNFPRSRVVGGKSMWISSEVDAWMWVHYRSAILEVFGAAVSAREAEMLTATLKKIIAHLRKSSVLPA
jgi:predicted DNA-binding transcriptional regulator AlpA